ncbi:MAG: DNA-formamidopyrimidine glycosylase [Erysipelotrichaceae bacterium]
MPELPEVETVIRTLEKLIKDQKITKVEVLYNNIIHTPKVNEFKQQISNQSFRKFKRRVKYLIFELDDYNLVVHLRMEGKFYYQKELILDKHSHIIFHLDTGYLVYHDIRKFGRMYLYSNDKNIDCLNGLGYEVTDKEMSVEYLYAKALKSNFNLKQFLLDQTIILGIGNIYANEICFLMKKHPLTMVKTLSKNELADLISISDQVLKKAISMGGTTIKSYTSSLGVSGRFQQELYVHGRQYQNCKLCNTRIIKRKINGRGSYICPCCQPYYYHRVALTGMMAAGKSTVIKYFNDLGFKTIDCDQVVDELLKKEKVLKQVGELLSITFTQNHQENKKQISAIIFSDQILRKQYEQLIYPLVLKELAKVEQGIFEVQRLFEAKFADYFDLTIAVVADELIIERNLASREMLSFTSARAKLQQNSNYYLKKADLIINNNGNKKQLLKKVKELGIIIKGEKICLK